MIPAVPVEFASGTVSELGESPRWDAARGVLWWVDITGSVLHGLSPDGSTTSRTLERHAGAVNLADDGRLLLATTSGLELLDPATGASTFVTPIEAGSPERRMNDAGVDPAGRVWAGTMRWDAGEPPHDGVLYRIDGDGPPVPVLTGLGCPNGLAWPTPSMLAYIDSLTGRIALWSVDPTTGELLQETGSIDVSAFDGIPDGLTLDADGTLWAAFWNGGAVRRFALDGTLITTIELPTPLVTSVAFGGESLATLYITTATSDAADADPAAGRLYRCEPGVRGTLPHRWPVVAH
ncbi:MAG TPA: SMP-30/gluconolactonase/LRE family protein [Plantibacter sp.]|uniref:SMP-30/gluconolactonase/LRE family protein n=1 Tax=unclassified Plantibacter TaxID=2624265 RepID=UPI002BD59E93|nr:SMP-30/gluconolactonase/LRE family protein [Plantibacter sp.]